MAEQNLLTRHFPQFPSIPDALLGLTGRAVSLTHEDICKHPAKPQLPNPTARHSGCPSAQHQTQAPRLHFQQGHHLSRFSRTYQFKKNGGTKTNQAVSISSNLTGKMQQVFPTCLVARTSWRFKVSESVHILSAPRQEQIMSALKGEGFPCTCALASSSTLTWS